MFFNPILMYTYQMTWSEKTSDKRGFVTDSLTTWSANRSPLQVIERTEIGPDII